MRLDNRKRRNATRVFEQQYGRQELILIEIEVAF